MNTIFVIAKGTFGEAMRRRILNVFLFVALALMIMAVAFSSFTPRNELDLIKSMGLGVIQISGVFISVILGINLIPSEIERRTIYTILSKPVQRYEFLTGKFLGGLMTVLANIGLMSLVFIILLLIKERAFDKDVVLVLGGEMMIAFQLMLVSAMAVMFSVLVSPFVNFFLSFSIYFFGSITSLWSDMATSLGHLALLNQYLFRVLGWIVPNFENYNVQNPIIHPDTHIQNETTYTIYCITYAVLYSLIMMFLAIIQFNRKEV